MDTAIRLFRTGITALVGRREPEVPPSQQVLPGAIFHRTIEHVIGLVHEAQSDSERWAWILTLRNCSLVCKAWHQSSKGHLALVDLVVDSEQLETVSKAISGAPEFGIWTRYLSIFCHTETVDGAIGYPLHNVSTRFPGALQGLLPHLKGIKIMADYRARGMGTASSDTILVPYLPLPPDAPLSYQEFSGITSLLLFGVNFSSFQDFATLMDCFPSLESMFCASLRWYTMGDLPLCMSCDNRSFLGRVKHLVVSRLSIPSSRQNDSHFKVRGRSAIRNRTNYIRTSSQRPGALLRDSFS